MLDIRYKVFELPLKHVFAISRSAVEVQATFVVQIACDGVYGYGEATTNDYYGATIERLASAVERVRPIVERVDNHAIAEVLTQVAEPLGADPVDRFALCAIDLALHDLNGKLNGSPLHKDWGLEPQRSPVSSYTIGIDTIPKMVAKLQEASSWPIYKIKLGTPDDLQIVKELRQHTDAVFRVDANCGWTPHQAIEMSHALKALNVEFIEQPLPAEDRAGAEAVYRDSALPVIADESCVAEADVDGCQGAFHAINIKLVKCGGLAPARRMIARARQLGLGVMVGCMTESSIGISAAAQIAPEVDYLDIDGAALLAEDIATGVKVINGVCHYPESGGSGVDLVGPLL